MNSLQIFCQFVLTGSLLATAAQAQSQQEIRVQELHQFLNQQYSDPNYRSASPGDDVLYWAYSATPTAHQSNKGLQLPDSPALRLYTDLPSLRNLDFNSELQNVQAICILVNTSAELNLVIPKDKFQLFPSLKYIIVISSVPLCAERSESTECQALAISTLFSGELPSSVQIFYTISIPE